MILETATFSHGIIFGLYLDDCCLSSSCQRSLIHFGAISRLRGAASRCPRVGNDAGDTVQSKLLCGPGQATPLYVCVRSKSGGVKVYYLLAKFIARISLSGVRRAITLKYLFSKFSLVCASPGSGP